MMIRLVVFLMLGMSEAASAQTVAVRSGDHGTFTRLALDMPYTDDWRIDPDGDGARVIFPESGLEFDISDVFDRISRNRLRAIDPAPGQLDLDLACDCDVTGFWHTDRMLVLDIAETRPSERPTHGRTTDPSSNRGLEPGLSPLSPATIQLSRRLASTGPYQSGAAVITGDQTISNGRPGDLSALRETLVREVGLAASQGLLTPIRKRRPDPAQPLSDDDAVSDPETARMDEADPAPPPHIHDDATMNLRARSSVDDAINTMLGAETISDQRENCVPHAWLDLPSWGGDAPFHQRIGELNRQLLGEFDQPDKEIALKLARSYLYYGFGAEARNILDLRGAVSGKDAVLREMALIMDQGYAPTGARLAAMAGCGGAAALWSVLSTAILPPERVIDHKALRRAFSAFPPLLRKTFGPKLARRLINAGHKTTAQHILRMTNRTGAADGSDLALARADLAATEDDSETSRSELDTAIADNSAAAPEALAQLIDGLLADAAPVPFDKAELAGAYAYEHRGTDLGRRMTGTYLAALGASGAFAKAVQEFERLRPDLDATGADDIAADLMQHITRNADDVTFLRHTLNDRLITPDAVPAALGIDIATRLLEDGFPEQARRFVEIDLPGRMGRRSKLTRARIALVRDRPRQAEVELLGLDGRDAISLRAQARRLVGDHDAARILFNASNQPQQALDAAWFAQDLDQLAEAEDPTLRHTAEVLQDSLRTPIPEQNATLERHRGLLESAGTLRDAMVKLLATKRTPTAPKNTQ